ncbi:MAG: HEAT repeat domain-containing protein [Planctomycetota bacterium]|jgi:HEAT repeat protein
MHPLAQLGGLCLGLAMTGSLPGQDLQKLISELGHPEEYRIRNFAYNQLRREDPKGQALPLLLESLPGFPIPSQSLGFYLIRSYPPSQRSSGMQRLLSSESAYLRFCAASQLFREGEEAQLNRIISELDAAKEDSLRLTMLSRLNGIKEEELIAWVRFQLMPEESPSLISAYLGYLLSTRDRESMATARALMESDKVTAETQSICAAYLLAAGVQSASKQLATYLKDADTASLSRANRFMSQAENLGKPVYEHLMTILSDEKDPYQLTVALNILGSHAHKPALKLIRAHLNSDHANVARAAHEALLGLAHELDPDELRGMLESSDTQEVLLAADLLRRMDDHSGLDDVIKILSTQGPQQLAAANSLGDFRVAAAVPPLLKALESTDVNLRSRALNSLEKVLSAIFPYKHLDLRSTGYAPEADEQTRGEGLAKIRAVWTSNKR